MTPITSYTNSTNGGNIIEPTYDNFTRTTFNSVGISNLSLWELDLRNTTILEWKSNQTFASTDTGYSRYGFTLNGVTVNGLLQSHTSANSTSKVPVTFSQSYSKIYFVTWYYKASYNSTETGGLLSATSTLFSQNYTIHPGGVYRDGSSGDALIFETNAGTSEFNTAAGTRYRISSGMNNYASGWHSLGYLFDSSTTNVGVYVNGSLIQTIAHTGSFGNFTGAQLTPWINYGGTYTFSNACMSYSMCMNALTLTNTQIAQIHTQGLNNLINTSVQISSTIAL
jgi:hypothetical protein